MQSGQQLPREMENAKQIHAWWSEGPELSSGLHGRKEAELIADSSKGLGSILEFSLLALLVPSASVCLVSNLLLSIRF